MSRPRPTPTYIPITPPTSIALVGDAEDAVASGEHTYKNKGLRFPNGECLYPSKAVLMFRRLNDDDKGEEQYDAIYHYTDFKVTRHRIPFMPQTTNSITQVTVGPLTKEEAEERMELFCQRNVQKVFFQNIPEP